MNSTRAVSALAALAQETRLDVFRLLVQAGPQGLPAGRIAERLDVPAPTLSFHLAQLKHAGLVSVRRDGRSLLYAPDFPVMSALLAFLTESCCRGDAARSPSTPQRAPRRTTR